MGLRDLSEAVLLQSFADLWAKEERKYSLKFFSSEDFIIWAESAGMSLSDQVKLLDMIRQAAKYRPQKKKYSERNILIEKEGWVPVSPAGRLMQYKA